MTSRERCLGVMRYEAFDRGPEILSAHLIREDQHQVCRPDHSA